MSAPTLETDLLLVGAGPVGLYGTYCAGFRGLRTVLVDGEENVGGQVSMLYPDKSIRDVAGIPDASGRALIAGLWEQAATYSPTVLLGHQVQRIDTSDPDQLTVELSGGVLVRCRATILTAGIGSFTPRRLAAEAQWSGTGVRYVVADLTAYRGRRVIVAGGGDSAVDWAHALAGVAESVTLVHRRREFRAHAAGVAQLANLGVRVMTDCEVAEFIGDGQLEAVRLTTPQGDTVLAADDVIVALGFISSLGPLGSWGLQMRGRAVDVDQKMRTSVPRVYAAGDIAEYDGKVRLISVGFGEVATAVGNAACDVGITDSLFPGHSTDLPAPTLEGSQTQ